MAANTVKLKVLTSLSLPAARISLRTMRLRVLLVKSTLLQPLPSSYFNSESESCGHPFCDKMVMSFQGGWYIIRMAYTVGDPNAQMPELDELGSGAGNGRASKLAAEPSKAARKALNKNFRALDSTTRRGTGADAQYYPITAVVYSGPVTVTSLSHSMEYNRGMMEFIAGWESAGSPVRTPPANVMLVAPYQMIITLASTADSYDSYQPRVDEGSYGKEGYHK